MGTVAPSTKIQIHVNITIKSVPAFYNQFCTPSESLAGFWSSILYRRTVTLSRITRLYRVFQKDLNIFYSGHRGHRT